MGLKSSTGGYWNERSEELRISQIKNWALCQRCRTLQKAGDVGAGSGLEGVEDSRLDALSPDHEMTRIFAEQVSKIRSKQNAVVVLCVDAVNPHGSVIRSLRNYVGGNPILLAVTRCDLLPEYVRDGWDAGREKRMKEFFRERAGELEPAGVYLCSVPRDDEGKAAGGDFHPHGGRPGGRSSGAREEEEDGIFDGAGRLANDLWHDADGRDPYVVGAANIGKSTLTDRLIDGLVEFAGETGGIPGEDPRKKRWRPWADKTEKEKRSARFRVKSDREMTRRRYESIQEARVTRSSLPGTTLQNIRVPCFPEHTQALWDTPGLVLDPSLSHYPIRDLRRIKATRPKRIVPQWHEVDRRAFALLVSEAEYSPSSKDNDEEEDEEEWEGDALDSAIFSKGDGGDRVKEDDGVLPLLRIEVRMKKDKGAAAGEEDGVGPVRLVWNSILNDVLATDVAGIEESLAAERKRAEELEKRKREEGDEQRGVDDSEEGQAAPSTMNPEERAAYKEERRLAFEERKKAEVAEMGLDEWTRIKKEEYHRHERERRLASLQKVSEDIIDPGKVMEISIEHFGSLVVLAPQACMVRIYAPSTGVQPACHPAMVVPNRWEEYVADDPNEFFDPDYDEDEDGDEDMYWDHEKDHDQPSASDPFHRIGKDQRWVEFSSEKVGWTFDEKPRFFRGKIVDGWNPATKKESKDNGDDGGSDDKKYGRDEDAFAGRRRTRSFAK